MLSHNTPRSKALDIQERTERLVAFAVRSAGHGQPLHDVERHVFDELLKIGYDVIETFVALQGELEQIRRTDGFMDMEYRCGATSVAGFVQ